MSIRVMTAVWDIDLPDSEKIVLLALADCANDEGACWPSMTTLARKCSKSDRTIQGSIKALVSKGHLSRIEKPGKGCLYYVHPVADDGMQGTNPAPYHYTYRITCRATGEFYVGARSSHYPPSDDRYLGSGAWVKSAKDEGRELSKIVVETYPSREALAIGEMQLTKAVIGHPLCQNKKVASPKSLSRFGGLTPEEAAPRSNDAPKRTTLTPEVASDKPSRTVNDLSNDKSKRVCVRKPAKLDQQIWDDWKRVRKKPVTPTVMSSMEREAAKLGWTVEQAITHAAENSWQGFKAAWIEKEAKNDNPKPSGRNAADLARRNLGCH